MLRFVGAAFLLLFMSQCIPFGAAWNTGRTDAFAENNIMLVLEHPESLGYKRLRYASELHPEFPRLLEKIGTPDCIAETTQGDRHYMILYQIEKKRAFSCRTINNHPMQPMQISGPYPMSKNEYNMLRSFKNRALSSINQN